MSLYLAAVPTDKEHQVSLNFDRTRRRLQDFAFSAIFIEELGWSAPKSRQPLEYAITNATLTATAIAELGGASVFVVTAADSAIPPRKSRDDFQRELSKQHAYENLLIFVDAAQTKSVWYWVKRDGTKRYPREHVYVKGQPGDLMLGKLNEMIADSTAFDLWGNVVVTEGIERLRRGLDIEAVTKKFYTEFKAEHTKFLEFITGIGDERDKRWYASVLLNRLMFIYFLQKKGFLDVGAGKDGNRNYLHDKLKAALDGGHNFYALFLNALFFEGFAKPEAFRSDAAKNLVGDVPYLNGGLFLQHPIEKKYAAIGVDNAAFVNLLGLPGAHTGLFQRYQWNLNDTPGEADDEINPDVLGYIFEKYINQKAFGAYYTRPEITAYLCEQTIHRLILEQVNHVAIPGIAAARSFEDIGELTLRLDAQLCSELLGDPVPLHNSPPVPGILSKLTILDPACGSGAFLVAAMNTLKNIYGAVVGWIATNNNARLKERLARLQGERSDTNYAIKRLIITNNLFGVDKMEEATEIAKLRLFLVLVASAHSRAELEPLPNIDFNVLPGDSLIGLLTVDQIIAQTAVTACGHHRCVARSAAMDELCHRIQPHQRGRSACR